MTKTIWFQILELAFLNKCNYCYLWQGHFFHNKAREADEESARKIFETRSASLSLMWCNS